MVKTFTENISNRGVIGFFKVLLRGAGQVMFQGSAWTGLFFIAGIFWGAYQSHTPEVAWGSLLGLMVSTATGYILNLPDNDGRQGLWGFNGILVGCAFPTFLGNTIWVWLSLALCAALTVWVREALNNTMKAWKVNSFTFPFVISTWLFLLASRALHGLDPTHMATPVLPDHISTGGVLYLEQAAVYWLRGVSQVFLIDSWVTGMLFIIGLLIASRWAALWAAIGSALSIVTASVLSASGYDIAHGLYSFSAVLTAIALATVFYRPSWRSAIWAILGVIITVVSQAAMNVMLDPLGLSTLTAPFCIATWVFLLPMFKFDEAQPDHSHWSPDLKKHLQAK
ncbi:MAG: urea transporter [Alistipes sp.]|nr:urea transporter [Alistipes sp.]